MSKQMKAALAVFLAAVAGGAAAQSNVVIYGTIDTGLGRTYTDAANANMVTSYDSTTLFGFRGSEDLGNGLKVNFQLEADGVKSDTGDWSNGFRRQSWVGLSGSFGEVMMGRTTTPQNRLMGTFDLNNTADGSSALYTRNEKTSEGDGWGLGIAAPIGKAVRVGAQYARITKHSSSAVKGSNAVELFADYALSKRTSFYANYGRVNSKAETWKKLQRNNTLAVGITHKF